MDFLEKSFSFAAEASKLLITLATALVAFCATIVNVKVTEPLLFTPATTCQKWLIAVSWLALLLSVAAGVWTQLAITDVLSHADVKKPPTAWNRKITFPFQAQIVAFVAGIVLLTLFGMARLFG